MYSIPPPNIAPPAQEVEEQRTVTEELVPTTHQEDTDFRSNPGRCPDSGGQFSEAQEAGPTVTVASTLQSTFTAQLMESLTAANSPQAASPRFSQYLSVDQHIDSFIDNNLPLGQPALGGDVDEIFQAPQFLSTEVGSPAQPLGNANISITRNEVLALTNVLSRIPQSFLSGETCFSPNLTVSVVDNPPGPSTEISPREHTRASQSNLEPEIAVDYDPGENPLRPSKRPRPR